MRRFALIGAFLLLVAACGGADADVAAEETTLPTTTVSATTVPATPVADDEMDDEEEMMEDEEMADEDMAAYSIVAEFVDLPPLEGAIYEGWGIVDGEPVSTGLFNIGADGAAVDATGAAIDHFPIDAEPSTFVVTIEPLNDSDPAPSATHILAGDLADMEGDLSIAHPAALGTDFADVAGKFILGTPTDDDNTNENSGVWFLSLPGPAASLILPTLPEGWAYEGWMVIDGTPVSTGTFLSAEDADDAAPFSGPNTGPNFPGEDFLANAPESLTFPTDLAGTTAVISVEPAPDDSALPFMLKPLVGDVAPGATDHVNLELSANADGIPSGRVILTMGG